jgi:hypothetical protein
MSYIYGCSNIDSAFIVRTLSINKIYLSLHVNF